MKGTKRSAIADDDDDDIWDYKSLKRIRKPPKLDRSARTRSANKSKSKHIVTRESHKGNQKPIALDTDSNTDDDSDDCQIVMSKVVNMAEKRRKSFLTSSLSNDVSKSMSTTKQTEFSVLGDNSCQTLQTIVSPQSKKPQQKSGKKRIVSKETATLSDKNQIKRKVANKQKSKRSTKLVKQENKGHCPFCQVPFSALLRLSPNAHTMECMDIPLLKGSDECQDGDSCHSRLPSHYRKYKHTVLAQFIREQLNIRGDNTSQSSSSTLTSASEWCQSDADHCPVGQDLGTTVSSCDISQTSLSPPSLESPVSSRGRTVGNVEDDDDGDVHDDEGSDVDIFADVEEISDNNRCEMNFLDEFEQKREIERDDLCHGDTIDGGGFFVSESGDDNSEDSNGKIALINAHCNEIDLSDDSSESEKDNLADDKTISDGYDVVGGK